jgi:uncharacterized protein (DUF488 family)
MASPPKEKGPPSADETSWESDQKEHGYYYDDAYGYEEYKDDGDPSGLTISTVGHSTLSFEEFLELLKANRIELVADVRSYPGSRRFPHFNSEVLGVELANAGIGYELIKELGGRRRVKPDSQNTVWRNEAFRGYADYMETDGFREGIETLLELAREKRTAVMCAEAVWWRCHRSMIADYLKSIGITVEHIMDGKTEVHPYTAAAKIVDGKLVYGPAE